MGKTKRSISESFFAIEEEKAVCGAIALETTAIYDVVNILTPDMFSDPTCSKIYTAALSLYDKEIKVDILTLSKELEKKGMSIDEANIKVLDVAGMVCSASNIEQHALYIKQAYIRRLLYDQMGSIISEIQDPTIDIFDILNKCSENVEKISSSMLVEDEEKFIGDIGNKAYEEYCTRSVARIEGRISGISTGFVKLDRITGGWKPGKLTILAARPAMGKTAMLLHFSISAAKLGYSVLIFSLEMGAVELGERIFTSLSNVNADELCQGTLSKKSLQSYYDATVYAKNLPITVIDSPSMNMRKIKNRAMRQKRKGKCDIVFIDYLQLVDMKSENRSYNREQEVSEASRRAKLLSKEIDCPVILLSQLNRAIETRSDKKPLLSDLRESGAIEQDADTVIFIHRPEYYDKNAPQGKGELIIAKNRSGKIGSMDFFYNQSLTQIYDSNIPF